MVLPKVKIYGDGTISTICNYVTQKKMCRTPDGTIHAVSCYGPPFFPSSDKSWVMWSYSRDGGSTWTNVILYEYPAGQGDIDFPTICSDATGNLYFSRVETPPSPSLDVIYFRKGTVDKTNPTLWIWNLGAEITVDSDSNYIDVPDIVVDSNNYIHITYMKGANGPPIWARSINGGATWTKTTLPSIGMFNLLMAPSIDKDSANNLYVGVGDSSFAAFGPRQNYAIKIGYRAGPSWGYTPQTLILKSSGYVGCVPGDVGKQVKDDGTEIGVLLSYNNTTRTWVIDAISTILTNSVMTITSGTGSGSANANSTGAAWQAVSSAGSGQCQLRVLPDDRICMIYDLNGANVVFRKTTNPKTITATAWNAQVYIATGTQNGYLWEYSLAYKDANNLFVAYPTNVPHANLDIVMKKSTDGGATWSVEEYLTNDNLGNRMTHTLKEMGSDLYPKVLFRNGIFTTMPHHALGDLWFMPADPPVHLESLQDDSSTSNLGTITFDGITYTLPNDVGKTIGSYSALYNAVVGYEFDHWVVTDGISVLDPTANPTTVTVASPGGTLRAIYKATASSADEIYRTHFLGFQSSGDVPLVYLSKDLIITKDGNLYLRLGNGNLIQLS